VRARVVIGANFGDEGKGLFTDFLCATQGADVVVRFNGGAQAGHTVITPDGRRHVFHHFGSGSFEGVPTFLSQFFVCNPILFFKELDDLRAVGVNPSVYAHPQCLITTFADMMINQRKEDNRGVKRHGSCGVGFHETQVRSQIPKLQITMADLWNGANLEPALVEICTKYASYRSGSEIANYEVMIESFLKGCEAFANGVEPLGIGQCKEPIFEGAQGLLLDQNNKEFFPHVTHSNTGMKNVMALCASASLDEMEAYYISRTYLSRHGAGALPSEDISMSFADETNVSHGYQGEIRFAPLDYNALLERCTADYGKGFKLVLTHCDQLKPHGYADYYINGPRRQDVSTLQEAA